jgi:hypothetical protein
MALISLIIVPGVTKIGWEMVRSDTVKFNEYWNGWELAASREDIICERDGSCSHDYDCDPYIVMVPYSCNCDGKGNCSTCLRPETRYHSCPYVRVEFTYRVNTTLGGYTIDSHRFPIDPQQHRWRRGHAIPSSIISEAGVGEPPFWRAVYDRVNAGRPGPVTARKEYDNYVLASDRTILKQYSSEIGRFQKANLLPAVQFGVHDFYLAEKVYFVGYWPANGLAWQNAVSRLNAALGSELQGDLHLVLVQDDAISQNPDMYAMALRAYWFNKEAQSKNAFAKNAIGIVVGTTDGQTVAWSRAFTGMPIGNEAFAVGIQSGLPGVAMKPEVLVGDMQAWFKTPFAVVQSIHGDGAIESLLWGCVDPRTKFQRYSMSGKSGTQGHGGGYLYLWGEIQPKPNEKFWIGFWTFFLSGFVWVSAAMISENYRKRPLPWNEF